MAAQVAGPPVAVAQPSIVASTADILESRVLHRSLREAPTVVTSAKGMLLHLQDGRSIIDATGGAAVACVGHGDTRISQAIMTQASTLAYCHTLFFATKALEDLADCLIASTYGDMHRAYFVSSGSEAIESALKCARQYHICKPTPEPDRTLFITRSQSYHGATLGALGISGFPARRELFEPMLAQNTFFVSPCHPYRKPDMGDEQYLAHLEQELEDTFQQVGPGKIAAFIAEPVSGAALGCVSAMPGYLPAMRRICDRHGALLILDEIMCGCGRVGPEPTARYPDPMHAYQDPAIGGGIVPDIVTMGKALGAGYQAIAAMLINEKVAVGLSRGNGVFVHGHTYQGHPVACRAALEVQRIIREDGLLQNVREQGRRLGALLHAKLESHSHVGDVRGRGMFWAIEFVIDKTSKKPFHKSRAIAWRLHQFSLRAPYDICLYPGSGSVDGQHGDHIIVAPAYNCTAEEVDLIACRTAQAIHAFFAGQDAQDDNAISV